MTNIISYAQNFEDVMLWRALGHVENGFYIDLGAQDPLIDSVSMVFHEHGWRGIHVEPTPHYAELLRQQRPGDTVIQAAVGNGPAVLTFFEIPDTGISTADPVIAQQHRERGFDVHEITVPCITLAAIFDSCAVPEIHWLKIDVEGFEQQVLSSWGVSTLRPWIVVVESTLPLTQIETNETWEGILINYDYSYVYFDGLNRYYISDAHPELKDAFRSPPNVFDAFTLNGTASNPIHHLLVARHKQQINEIVAQNEQQKLANDHEIERLTLSLGTLEKTHAEHEQNLTRREQEIAAQLLAIQQQAAQEIVEQTRSHNAQAQNLQRQHIEHEQTLSQQHHAHLQDIQRQQAEHEWLTAERIHTLNLELHRLQADMAAREQTHADMAETLQKELTALLRMQAQRDQEMAAQLHAILQQADQEKIQQIRDNNEQERKLRNEHAEREHAIAQHLYAAHQELRSLEQQWVQREIALHAEITALKSEMQASQHAQQLHTHQHEAERSAAFNDHHQLSLAYESLQTQLKTEIVAAQQSDQQLRQALADVRQNLAVTHASLTWCITAPLRALASILTRKKSFDSAFPITDEATPAHATMSPIQASQPASEPTVPIEPTMFTPTPTTKPIIASTLDELLAQHDQHFIHCAYQTLLGRAPDPEGLRYYLNRLRTGVAKIQILAQLRGSSEGKACLATLHNLDSAIHRYKKAQWPLVGWLFAGVENKVERKLRVIENQIFVFSDDSNRRLNQLETTLDGLHHHLLGQQSQTVIATLGGSSAPTQPIEPDRLKQLTPRARSIYFQLKTAAAMHAGRTV